LEAYFKKVFFLKYDKDRTPLRIKDDGDLQAIWTFNQNAVRTAYQWQIDKRDKKRIDKDITINIEGKDVYKMKKNKLSAFYFANQKLKCTDFVHEIQTRLKGIGIELSVTDQKSTMPHVDFVIAFFSNPNNSRVDTASLSLMMQQINVSSKFVFHSHKFKNNPKSRIAPSTDGVLLVTLRKNETNDVMRQLGIDNNVIRAAGIKKVIGIVDASFRRDTVDPQMTTNSIALNSIIPIIKKFCGFEMIKKEPTVYANKLGKNYPAHTHTHSHTHSHTYIHSSHLRRFSNNRLCQTITRSRGQSCKPKQFPNHVERKSQ